MLNNLQTNEFDSPGTKDPISSYILDENKFQQTIKDEYCHYEKRYFAALDSFLQSIASSSLENNQGINKNDIDSLLTITRNLNIKLTVLTQIVNGISKYSYKKSHKFQSDIDLTNNQLKERRLQLEKQNAILQKENASLDMSRRLVDYTTEKNKANNNLLTIYGVLNIVAIAMVLYISRG
jgi:hypothetical protein